MRRYFFDLSGDGWEPDSIGTELPDDASALREAIRFAGEVLKDEPHRLERGRVLVNVHDQDFTVRFLIEMRLMAD